MGAPTAMIVKTLRGQRFCPTWVEVPYTPVVGEECDAPNPALGIK